MRQIIEGDTSAFSSSLAILVDVFLAVVVPRRSPLVGRSTRLSSYLIPGLWRVWRGMGLRMNSAERREGLLGMFGSLGVIVLLVGWVACLIFGYGLILYALRAQLRPQPENFGAALYFAGVSMLTLGFGEIVPVGGAARLTSLVAAASGLGLFALVITFVFTLYGSFQRREVAVVVLEAGAGAPPSGVNLLETYALLGILDDLPRVFADWQAWSAEVLDSHLAYPILAYFRSSHDNDSWISSLGAVMDAATLVLTTIEGGPNGWAKLSPRGGRPLPGGSGHLFRLQASPKLAWSAASSTRRAGGWRRRASRCAMPTSHGPTSPTCARSTRPGQRPGALLGDAARAVDRRSLAVEISEDARADGSPAPVPSTTASDS